MINKILEKIINPEKVITKLMLLAGSFILILNQFTLEYLLFPESAVMCLGVLFNVIAIKFMVDNPKCKYIKIFLALLVAVFCYRGVLNMFPVLAILVYIVKQILDKREYKVKEKEFFVEMKKLAFIVIVVLAICYEEFSEEQLVFKGNTLYNPSFKRMTEDIKNKIIDTIYIQDLSRLGRNRKELIDFSKNILDKYDSKIILINEKVDFKTLITIMDACEEMRKQDLKDRRMKERKYRESR